MINTSDWRNKQKERRKVLRNFGNASPKNIFSLKRLYLLTLFGGIGLLSIVLGVYFYGQREQETALIVAGNIINVRRGGDFQKALNLAKSGDTILLEAGAEFKGKFVLPNKPGSEYITIRSSAPDAQLPSAETRIDPKKHAALMPKILTISSEPAITTEKNSHHYRFIGVEISSATDQYVYNLVLLGDENQEAQETPHHFEFDRCYIHPNTKGKVRRGIGLISSDTIIKNSYIAGFAYPDEETQAIASWLGPGPYKIINNYLEAGAENLFFGGDGAKVKGRMPSDIEIRGNYMTKPLEWRGKVSIKCVLELKSARRVIVSGNILENSFDENAIRFTVRGGGGTAPWNTIEDVVVENNIIRHSGGGINFLGVDDSTKTETMKRVKIHNNLFIDIDSKKWGSDGRFMTISDGEDVSITNNTIFHSGNIIMAHGKPSKRFVFRDNIVSYNDYGYNGEQGGVGRKVLEFYFPDMSFIGNVIVNNKNLPEEYTFVPARNRLAGDFQSIGFMDLQNGNYRLSPKSPFKGKGTDGKDPGVDFDMFERTFGGKPF